MIRYAIIAVVVLGFLFVGGWPALALDIDAHTPCSVAVKTFDNKDKNAILDVGLYIKNTMEEMDSKHTDIGEPGIMSELTDNGLSGLIAAAVVHCRTHPKATIYNATAFVYRGIRSVEMQYGLSK